MIFWWMSLFGAMCTTSFALEKGSLFFMAGPCVNFFIFARNLFLVRTGRPLEGKVLLPFAFGLGTLALAVGLGAFDFSDSWPWLLVGGFGTVLWTIRFPLQWWISERRGEATLPRSFFWVSFVRRCSI